MMRYLRIFGFFTQHVFQNRARFFMYFINSFINPLVVLMFWGGILSKSQQIGQWNWVKINSYFLVYIVATSLVQHAFEDGVANRDIKGGELVRSLLRPFSYFKLKLIEETPLRLLQGLYSSIAVCILSYLLTKPVSIFQKTDQIGYIVVMLIGAYMLSYTFKMCIAFCAFWLTNAKGVLETNDVLRILLSGVLVPMDLAPKWIASIAAHTPFPYIMYYPVAAIVGIFDTPDLQKIILIQFAWIAGLYLLYRIMWKYGVRQFTGVGQ